MVEAHLPVLVLVSGRISVLISTVAALISVLINSVKFPFPSCTHCSCFLDVSHLEWGKVGHHSTFNFHFPDGWGRFNNFHMLIVHLCISGELHNSFGHLMIRLFVEAFMEGV